MNWKKNVSRVILHYTRDLLIADIYKIQSQNYIAYPFKTVALLNFPVESVQINWLFGNGRYGGDRIALSFTMCNQSRKEISSQWNYVGRIAFRYGTDQLFQNWSVFSNGRRFLLTLRRLRRRRLTGSWSAWRQWQWHYGRLNICITLYLT